MVKVKEKGFEMFNFSKKKNKNIEDIFDSKLIEYYKTNKNEITSELLQTLRSKGNLGKQIALDILDTEKTKDNYYVDSYDNKISFDGDRELKKSFTPMSLSKIHLDEIKKCSDSLDYFRENYVKIRTKDGVNFPELRSYQDGFLKALMSDYETVISLQPRQAGKSCTTGIYLLWKFVFDHDKNIGICANKRSLAKEFLNNVKNMFYNLPMWMKVGITVWNKSDIESENKMRILTDSPSSDAFRGFTISILVVDETAFIKSTKFKEFIDAVTPTQSALAWKKNLFISTANGLNHFYEYVDGAKKRKEYKEIDTNEYNKIIKKYKVLSQSKNDDGTWNVKIDEPSNGMLFFEVHDYEVPRYDSKGNLISYEDFKEKIVDKYGLVYYNQNYGNQFIGSSYTLIDSNILKELKYKDSLYIINDKLKIYQEPKPAHKYIMGVDPAKGGLDAFAIQIIDVTSFPFVQVASAQIFSCNWQLMPDSIYEWANYYNKAFLIIENNEGSGTFIATMLRVDYEYENLYTEKIFAKYLSEGSKMKISKDAGFRTTSKNRNQILDTVKNFIDNNRLIIVDKSTIKELYTFIIKDKKYQADDGCHDDLVMALALCFVPFIDSRNFEDLSDLFKKLFTSNDEVDVSLTDYLMIGDFDCAVDEDESSLAGKKYDSEYEYSYDWYSRNRF